MNVHFAMAEEWGVRPGPSEGSDSRRDPPRFAAESLRLRR